MAIADGGGIVIKSPNEIIFQVSKREAKSIDISKMKRPSKKRIKNTIVRILTRDQKRSVQNCSGKKKFLSSFLFYFLYFLK
jgi:hypothetical protein